MNNFFFQNATKVYFGKGVAKEYLKDRTASAQTILLAYGGGSIKRNGIYDEITGIFNDAGKTIVESWPTQPTPRCRKAPNLLGKTTST